MHERLLAIGHFLFLAVAGAILSMSFTLQEKACSMGEVIVRCLSLYSHAQPSQCLCQIDKNNHLYVCGVGIVL